MAELATQHVETVGLEPTYAAAASGGDTYVPGDRVMLHVQNGDTSAHDVTLVTPGTVDGDLAVQDRTVSVPAGSSKFIAAPSKLYRGSDGKASLSYPSGVTSVTLAVLRV